MTNMNDINTIEKILINSGEIVTHATLSKYFLDINNINNKISQLINKGFLVQLKKGLYYISKLGTLGYTSLSSYALAHNIGKESFVSFEGALQYYGLFDQGLKKYRSISKKQYLAKTLENTDYLYIKVKEDKYFGFIKKRIDNTDVKIATKERALLDLIEYQRSAYSVSLVIEKLSNYKEEFSVKKLEQYLKNYSQTTIKTMGLIFDFLKINSNNIKKLIASATSTHRLLKTSNKFSSKWRIYYDSILETQKKINHII